MKPLSAICIAHQITSWNAGDPDAYAHTYTPDGDCVNFLGTHHRGRDAIAASGEVPRPGSLLKKLTRERNSNSRSTTSVL